MKKNNRSAGTYIAGLIAIYLCIAFFSGLFPFPPKDAAITNTTISQTCKFTTNLASRYNESFLATDAGGTLKIYDLSWNLLETLTYSSGFASVNYYDSGDSVRYLWSLSGWQSVSGVFTFPFYATSDQPISGLHTMDSIIVSEDPVILTMFSINDGFNTSAIVQYNVTTSGTRMDIEVIFRNSLDDSCNFNYADQTYSYRPIVIVENEYYNASAKPLDISISGLTLIQAPTSTQSGIYMVIPAENSLDRNINQATDVLITNNYISVSFSVDCTQIDGSDQAFLSFTLFENDDAMYHTLYDNPLATATTWSAPATFNIRIVY